jgi:hypothetical protein
MPVSHRDASRIELFRMDECMVAMHSSRPNDSRFRVLDGKRPEFPSGMRAGERASMPSWLQQRKRVLDDRFAGGERCRRSGV